MMDISDENSHVHLSALEKQIVLVTLPKMIEADWSND